MSTEDNIVAQYDYTDESGALLYQNVRYENNGKKTFRQRRPDGNGGWVWNLDGVRRVLYHLPEVLRADPDECIFYVEGEKDTLSLTAIGLVATTAGAAHSWKPELAEFLNDRKVIVLHDADEPGEKLAERVAKDCRRAGCVDVKIVDLPGLAEKQDVSDWLDNGGTKEDLLKLIESADPFTPQRTFNLTDAGNGERFAARHSHKIRYCWDWGRWVYNDGRRWNTKTGNELARRLAVETARSIMAEAVNQTDHAKRAAYSKWSLASETQSRLQAMLACAQAQTSIAVYADRFDTDPYLLNCLNGTINLRTGEIRPHDTTDMITRLAPVEYDPGATFDMWDNFLATATKGDMKLQEFLCIAAGYTATGDTGEEKLFLIHGPEASGKSTYLEAKKAILGDYAQTADFETFLKRSQTGGIRNDIAKLDGARMVVSIEVEEGKKLAEGLVKLLTGGDTVSARFLYKESFEFNPQFKLWLAANHAPRVKDDDAAMWRRILRVPFEHTIPKDERDPNIKATLKNPKIAGPAILAWIVQGCLMWQKTGLVVPEVVERATEEYRQDQDPLKDFFEDECEFDQKAYVPVSELRAAYDQHCKDSGARYPLGPRQFNDRLRARNCSRKPIRYLTQNGTEKIGKCWLGVTLTENTQYQKKQENQEQNQSEIPF